MTISITEECINCGACAFECPTDAIYEPDRSYGINGKNYHPISEDHFFIVTEICNECAGFEEIKCVEVCPMNAFQIKEP